MSSLANGFGQHISGSLAPAIFLLRKIFASLAKGKVVLLLCIRLSNGKRVYAAPVIAKNEKIKPLAAVMNDSSAE